MAPSYPQTMDIHAGRYSGTSSTANIDGTASQPAIAFGDDQDTGIYSPSNNKIGLSTGGAETVCVDSTGLDLANGKVIKINGSTILTATSFTGTAANATNAASATNATNATNTTNVTVADESSDTTCFPLFATAATGNLPPKSGSNLTFNSSSGALTATSFSGTTFSGDLNGTVNTATTGTTQSAGNNSTKIATTAYVDTATAALVDSAPTNLNTLNELAAALNDDADLANTVNTNIAAKLPLAGGQMTGNITFSGSQTVDGRDVSADGSKLDGIATSANAYTHPNHSGDVTSSSDGATTIANDAVTGAKIADNAIDSEHYTDGSIDTAHIAADQITGALIADDAVGAEHIEVLDADLKFVDSAKVSLGTGNDFKIYHNGTDNYIIATSGDIRFDTGSAELARITQGGDIELPDNGEYRCGTGDDLTISHNGSDSTISNGTGNLRVRNAGEFQVTKGSTENMLIADPDGSVDLYYDNSKKLETKSTGVGITGELDIDGNIDVNSDTAKVKIGAGDDLQLYHDGSNSYILNGGGDLRIMAKPNEYGIEVIPDGLVSLYHNNVKKLETISSGIRISAAESGEAWAEFYADEGDDDNDKWRLGASSNNDLFIQNYAGGSWETNIKAFGGGAVELYYNHVKKFETTNDGITVTGDVTVGSGNYYCNDNGKLRLGGSQDLQIYHDGSNSYIDSDGGDLYIDTNSGHAFRIKTDQFNIKNAANNETLMSADNGGGASLYYDNSKKLETASHGVVLSDYLDLNVDGKELRIGAGNDLKVYHDGTNTNIRNITGEFRIRGDLVRLMNSAGSEVYLEGNVDGNVELYYDNSKKFETNSGGVTVSGHAYFNDDNGVYIGSGEDLKIYHDGTNTYFKNHTTGSVYHRARTSFFVQVNATDGGAEWAIKANQNDSVELYHDGSIKLNSTSSGATCHGTLAETSDVALKRHIKVIDNPLTKLKEINGYTYQFKENGQSSVGVIAQDVEKVFPQLVHGVEGTKSVDYSGLIGVLIESVKELNTEIVTNASDIVNNGSRISECTSDVSGVIDDDKIESKTQIQDGINKIKALTSYQVTLKEDSKIRDGFVSSDVKTIYGREETSLIPTLTAALSEAIQKIEALEAKVSALEAG